MSFELTKDFIDSIYQAIQQEDKAWLEENIFQLHHADIAAIFEELKFEAATHLFRLLSDEMQADVLVEFDDELKNKFIESFSTDEIVEQLEQLDSDDAADIVGNLSDEQAEEVISKIKDNEIADDIVDLLNYESDTAGGIMQKEFIQAQLDWPVNRCIIELRRQAEDVEKIFTIYVVDENNKLVGFLSLKSLLFADTKTKIREIYNNKNVISVKTNVDDEEVGMIMKKYDLVSIPVVDLNNKLVGRITIDDVVDVIQDEADKDFQMASGISENIESTSSVWKMSRARLPWLLIGLIGGVLGAQVISGFEGGISNVPSLAFFIPLITAMGGNIGVQSSAIVVQSLARGEKQFDSIFQKLGKETLVAILNGLLLSLIIFGVAYLFDSPQLGLVVSISLFTVIIFAAIFGTLIPLLLDKYKIDPALATGPFITTLNDVLGLFIYLSIGMFMFNV